NMESESKKKQLKAQKIFQTMPLEKQKELKEQFPELYNALWDSLLINMSAVNQFIEKFEPLNERIRNFDELEKLSLTAQVEFKNQFPKDYARIMNLSTEQNNKFSDVEDMDDFEKLPDEDKKIFKKEYSDKYHEIFNPRNAKLRYLKRREKLMD